MILLWFAAFMAFALSVFARFLVELFLNSRIAILGSFAGFERSFNHGVAFGITFAPSLQMILIIGALCAVLWMAERGVHTLTEYAGFGLIVGGGLANILDRIGDGTVTDFIQVGSFPVFNIADCCITVGVVLLLWGMIINEWRQ
ncbi:MAG: signal peptidase II [Candidatus Peribacteraceae bacterium]|nr:signal peptidase II [Candidatus Peribacteraceae bacterium]MDD5074613.1 signal peptidase II [Candidatus Peribacteraceae bacterium]